MNTNKIDALAEMAYLRGRLKELNHGSLVMTVDKIEPAVAELIEAMRKIEAELATTVLQLAPSDDQIIADHVRNSARVATAALAKVQP